MTPKQELRLAYALAIILFVVGVLSYAMTAFSAKTPDSPMRVMFKGVAGKVLFTHKTHTDDSGYGIACVECHHHPQDKEDETEVRACGDCHTLADKEDALPQACADCHEADEIEDSEMLQRVDAFHMQCNNCHKENEAGPEKCESCHVK